MVTRRNQTSPADGRLPEDWPQLLRFAVLVVAVGGVLLLGAALRTAPPSGSAIERAPTPLPAAPSPPPPTTPSAPPRAVSSAGAPLAPPLVDPLAARAAADLDRFSAPGGGWTAQLAALCDPVRVEGLLEQFGNHAALYLIPWEHGGRSCFRVCWNRYATRAEAERASDLPRALRAVEADPLPKPVDEVAG